MPVRPCLFPNAILVNNAPFIYGLGYMACHGLSVLLGSGFKFLSAIAVQGILLILFPANIALSISRRYSIFMFDAAFLRTYSTFPESDRFTSSMPGIGPIAPFWPPIWFLGVYEVLLGSRDPVMLNLAVRAINSTALSWGLYVF